MISLNLDLFVKKLLFARGLSHTLKQKVLKVLLMYFVSFQFSSEMMMILIHLDILGAYGCKSLKIHLTNPLNT